MTVPAEYAIGGEDFLSLLQLLEGELEVLPDKPDETPENTLLCLWALAEGTPLAVSQLPGMRLGPLMAPALGALRQLVTKRLDGTPLAHLTGRQDFMGLVLKVSRAALVPRRETELLGYAAARKALEIAPERAPLVLDVCTGAGNLALGIAHEVPQARVLGSDLSPEAVELAQENARFVGRADVEFRCGDLLEPFELPEFVGQVDVLVCNPPYISSTRVTEMPREISAHEPRLAFDGGPFGVKLVRRLIERAPTMLKPGGWLLFEIGLGQGEPMTRLLSRTGRFAHIETILDASGEIRALAAMNGTA